MKKNHRCNDHNCPDCYPEYWQPEDDSHQALAWPYAAGLMVLLLVLALVYIGGAPGP